MLCLFWRLNNAIPPLPSSRYLSGSPKGELAPIERTSLPLGEVPIGKGGIKFLNIRHNEINTTLLEILMNLITTNYKT